MKILMDEPTFWLWFNGALGVLDFAVLFALIHSALMHRNLTFERIALFIYILGHTIYRFVWVAFATSAEEAGHPTLLAISGSFVKGGRWAASILTAAGLVMIVRFIFGGWVWLYATIASALVALGLLWGLGLSF